MASNQNNQKISQIQILPSCTDFPLEYGFTDPGLLEQKSLLMLSQSFSGGIQGRRKRDMSTRLTYDDVYRMIFDALITRTGKSNFYQFSGNFNFATHGVNIYCSNPPPDGSPGGRYVINYLQCMAWFNAQKDAGGSGFIQALKAVGYIGDYTNEDYNPPTN